MLICFNSQNNEVPTYVMKKKIPPHHIGWLLALCPPYLQYFHLIKIWYTENQPTLMCNLCSQWGENYLQQSGDKISVWCIFYTFHLMTLSILDQFTT